MVQHDADEALRGIHDKGRDAQGEHASQYLPLQPHAALPNLQGGSPAHQERHHPGRAEPLGDYRGHRRALHPHAKPEDEHRIQDDVRHRPDQHGEHGRPGLALADDEGVQPQGHLHEQRPCQVDGQIVRGIANRGIAGAEHVEQGPLEQIEECHQRHRAQQQEADAVAQDLLRPLPVPLPQPDGRQGSRTVADERGKGGDEHRDAEGDAYTCEGIGSHALHMPDVNPVDDAV